MNNWGQFIKTTCGAKLKCFLVKLNNEIWDVNNNPSKKNAVLLLNTRKGYWIYKVFEKNTEDVHDIELYSDRYVRKIVNVSKLKDKFIYLVDDSLSQGESLLETYRLLNELGIDQKMIFPVVYALSFDIDIAEKVENARRAGQSSEVYFWEKLNYFIRMSDTEIGDLCMKQTEVLQKEGIPFVIDLPFFYDVRTDDFAMDFKIQMTKGQIEKLKNGDDRWQFHENSYVFNEKEMFPSFIIQMKDTNLIQITSQFAVDFVIEGIYVEREQNDIQVILIPFAILRSMDKDYLCELWENLFFDCKNPEYLVETDELTDDSVSQNILRGRYRECVYFLSMYVGECFRNYMKSAIGIELEYNYHIMEDHYPEEFIKIVHKLNEKMRYDSEIVYKRLKTISEKRNTVKENYGQLCLIKGEREPYNASKAYKMLVQELRNKKNRYLQWRKEPDGMIMDPVLSIEEIKSLMRYSFSFQSLEQEQYALTCSIVTMLNLSICSNKIIICKDGVIKRGFRYGENSDLLLPFLHLYYFWAVVLLITKVGMEEASRCYDDFASAFRKWMLKDDTLKDEISQDIFEDNRQYFAEALKNESSIYNKSSLLEPYYHYELTETRMECMNKIEEFVVNY